MPSTSISRYLDYIAGIVPRESMFELFAAGTAWLDGESGASDLIVYDISARRWLAKVKASLGSLPWFTPDGRETWCRILNLILQGSAITEDSESNVTKLEPLGPTVRPSGGCP